MYRSNEEVQKQQIQQNVQEQQQQSPALATTAQADALKIDTLASTSPVKIASSDIKMIKLSNVPNFAKKLLFHIYIQDRTTS